MFSWEFCEISKNTFFTEHLWTAASVSALCRIKLEFLPYAFESYHWLSDLGIQNMFRGIERFIILEFRMLSF